MDLEKNKETFLKIARTLVKRDGLEDLLDWLEKSDFFTAPASTKFHGSYEGGLCQHSLNVFAALLDEAFVVPTENIHDIFKAPTEEDAEGEAQLSETTIESIAIVSLFHDICKVNFYKVGYKNQRQTDGVVEGWVMAPYYTVDDDFPCGDHADKSVILLQRFMKLEPEEILAIRAHMGGFDSAAKGGSKMIGNIFSKSRLAVFLHIADLKATYLLDDEPIND